ncbi:uncharacterized protein LOC107819112 [Nicotiana tabacum]|uniref:Uncharacterized protein LOC107819112 n=1 Tax=Nicotiana tabacum TaxID=4097 RepID=A0A1S4CI41_TOBAC
MGNIKKAQFPKPMKYDASKRDPNLWCKYHGTHGHKIGDCRHLREEVEKLLKNGHIREFLSERAKNNYGRRRVNAEPSKKGEDPPRFTINMIFGGTEINGVTFLAAKKTKVSVTHSKRLGEVAEDDITFMKLGQHYSMESLGTSQINRSIIPTTKLLAGFNLASVTTRGEILLPTSTEGVTKTTFFEVVDYNMGYNIILNIPWLHEMKAIPSTYHQLLVFLTPEGIKQIRGDQPVAREMNVM